MMRRFRLAWDGFVRPMLQRPPRLQVAALCYRKRKDGKEVLLVTSRGTGRWILPKGWPIRGKDASGSAMQEAWEEAGVRRGQTAPDAIGSYFYRKTDDAGLGLPVQTLVFPVAVEEMADDFPEARERERRWVSPGEAADMVQEPELRDILREL
ncbi:NUDIX hydrolase [Vannielia litorea]|uniref:8-oxo-dGTP pyrophosphatase MutT, NUDIX family n=1 Tax=Vannielia litorea TaxID=1217970 RepID=A0A1N6G4T7_9RHOB|nr:NUDIX hydrolase [Vannielia litorea]SIO02520.1 8-oxo-dGTP pyrophosphatase MutT, NUDIX family [Vannielia litorea]